MQKREKKRNSHPHKRLTADKINPAQKFMRKKFRRWLIFLLRWRLYGCKGLRLIKTLRKILPAKVCFGRFAYGKINTGCLQFVFKFVWRRGCL